MFHCGDQHTNIMYRLVILIFSIFVCIQCPSCALEKGLSSSKRYQLKQVQIVHRHGDRTPITPMKDEEFWSNSLPEPFLLKKISEDTNIIQLQGESENSHAAKGRGVFGKLTKLGLLQMVEVGTRIREQLHTVENYNVNGVDDPEQVRLFHAEQPLHPKKIKVYSTNFPRTLQSVQAVLVGMFPEGLPCPVDIDATNTNILIPDPQPRATSEQVEVERRLAMRPHMIQREKELKDLAIRVSNILRNGYLGEDADQISFGVGEDNDVNSNTETPPLAWSQLSEITTCLRSRGKLPDEITHKDHETITSHSAWRWFENLRDPQLSKMAMRAIVAKMLQTLKLGVTDDDEESCNEILYLYSAHDSSLIGLLCAFRLDQPAKWPEYGSYFKIELIQEEDILEGPNKNAKYYVRFSLNGDTLKCNWGVGHPNYKTSTDLIPLDVLTDSIHADHSIE